MLVDYLKKVLLFICVVCAGCTSVQMPHGLGAAECNSGNCSNGTGTLYSPYAKLSYQGQWKNGAIADGAYKIKYKGEEFSARYQDGRPIEGTKFYPHSNWELDYFTGEWTQYYDPFSQKTISFPREGIYHSITGATLTGEFYAIPSRGFFKNTYEKNPGIALNHSIAKVIFIGKVNYQGEEEITTLASADYYVGSPLISSKYSGLKPSDPGMLAQFKRDLESEHLDQQQAKRRKQQNSFDIGKALSIAATIAVASSSFSQLAPEASFLAGNLQSVASSDSSTKPSQAVSTNAFAQHKERVTTQVQSNVNRIEQRYAPPPKTNRRLQQPLASNSVKEKIKAAPVQLNIEASGTTGSFFPYEQAIDLSQTQAENKAHSMCRNDHGGQLTRNSGNMAKKNCQQHNTNNEFRCNVTMIFICQKD